PFPYFLWLKNAFPVDENSVEFSLPRLSTAFASIAERQRFGNWRILRDRPTSGARILKCLSAWLPHFTT
ncbi:hypothetical protein, partial [Mesorhizobium mediterraneum]|uniref:hypothetical protein n=1 Tax=Mesorhizobium mediterraneum TaxID=43617 RepID=UPI001AEE8B8D